MSSFMNFKNCGYTTHPEVLTTKPMLTNSNSPLTQQSSLYALTFDESQKTLAGNGKDFGSMNMDELFKNIWTSEETQAMKPNSNCPDLQKQCSLTLQRTFSQKTVDEVWRELLKENGGLKDEDLINEPNLQPQEKQPALGEMITLEEFLQKTGVAPEINQTQPNRRLSGDEDSFLYGFRNPNQNPEFHQQTVVSESKTEVNNLEVVRPSQSPKPQKILLPKHGAFNFTTSLGLVKNRQMVGPMNGVSIIGKIDNPNSNLDTSPSSPSCAYGEGGVHKRKMSGSLEKVVERRRKRMIKNRESAARSRARKQAYTLELEAEVAKFKELNHELQKKQEELMESQKIQVPEKIKLWGNTRLCLRRTLTGPW